MDTIYKYKIKITDRQTVQAPYHAVPIHVGLDPQNVPCIWAEVDSSNSLEPIDVFIVGTGNPRPEEAGNYIGSFNQGRFVWHVYTK